MGVGYTLTTQDNVTYETVGTGWGGWRWGWGGTETTTAVHTTVGTLVIAIFDGSTKNLIWHGSGQSDLKQGNASPQQREQKIDEIVTKILQEFPPPASK